jgi:hypothetical protein
MEFMYMILQENIKKLESLSLGSGDTSQIDTQALIESISQENARDFASEHKISDMNELQIPKPSTEAAQVDKVLYENMILKKAVVKLLEKLNHLQSIEKENNELKGNLQEMHIANYTLKMHLFNALEGKNVIENGKDIY